MVLPREGQEREDGRGKNKKERGKDKEKGKKGSNHYLKLCNERNMSY